MAILTGSYTGARGCTGGPSKGATALMSWCLGAFRAQHAHSDGIYNCRPVRGGGTWSLHAEGRAIDLGCDKRAAWAKKFAEVLRLHSAELGIQCVIFDRRIWSSAHALEGWRHYGGVDDHTTHIHIELTQAAAKGLTVAHIAGVLTPKAAAKPAPPKPTPAPAPAHPQEDDDMAKARMIIPRPAEKKDGDFPVVVSGGPPWVIKDGGVMRRQVALGLIDPDYVEVPRAEFDAARRHALEPTT